MNVRIGIVNLASVLALASLAVGMIASILCFLGRMDFDAFKLVFNLMSLLWFLTAPLWITPQLFGEAFTEAGKKAWLRPKG